MKIISTSQLQKNIWSISKDIDSENYTIINRWKPKLVILPYFDDNEEFINDYLEEYEIKINSKKLKKDLQNSLDSWRSDLII